MRKSWISGMIATGAAGAAMTGIAFAAGPSGTEHFTFVSTSTTNEQRYSAIGTGPITAGGTADLAGKTGKIVFPNGTINLTSKLVGAPTEGGSRQKCLSVFAEKGTYTLTGGTGAYAGISGSGRFTLTAKGIGATRHGKCDTSRSANPLASQEIITASGPLSVG